MAEGDRRTFASYKAEVLHALGNPATADMDITAGAIVNDALTHISAMHQWQWKSTGHVNLSIVADQDYVELPADYGSIIALQYADSWSTFMEPTTWDILLRLREHPVDDPDGGYYYVINTGNVEVGSEDAGLSLPTLNLAPTPTSSVTDAISMAYLRFLRRMVDTTDRPQWPAYMDRPLSLLSRAFAKTDYDDDPQSAYTVEFSKMIVDCISFDGLSTGSFGQLQGGAAQMRPRALFGYPTGLIPDPSVAPGV